MKLKLLGITCILLFLFTGTIFGAVTGKITGVITAAEDQQPLVGVTVAIQGTTWGAITDVDGRYSIINVPVGTYVLTFSAVGYASIEVSNVLVHADLATYQSHAMSSKVQELGTTISVTAETPLIIKDKTTTISIVSKEDLQAMPTRGFEQVVGIQNSVVRMNSNVDIRQRGGRESRAMSPEINLRGGRPSEVAYYVDGFSQQDPLTGISTANISNNAIQEVSVQSGAFSAEYGHVASGIVNVTTNSGTKEYHASLEGVTDNFLSGSKNVFDQNFYSGDFSGPLPGLEKGYFYFSGERRYLQDRTPSSKTEEVFDAFGMPHDGPALPNNSLSGWSYQGKVDYNFTPNLKLTINGNGSVDNWQEYRNFYYNPAFPDQVKHSPRYEDKNLGVNAKITHTLNAQTFYNLSVSYFVTERFGGDGVIFDDLAAYERELANPEYDYYNLFREGDSMFASNFDPLIEVGSEADTFITFYDSYWGNYLKRKSAYVGFKGDITSQLNASNTAKFGFDFQRHTLRYFEQLNATQGYSTERVNRYGYDSLGNESDNEGVFNETKHPINLGIYVQDRFDWRGLIVNAGLRFDYFDYKAQKLKDLSDPFGGDGILDEADLEDSEKFTRVSPRLGISFPVSDRTQMHINFGKFFQRPDLNRLYVGYDFFETRVSAGSYYPIGSPNLKPEKITQYEFGINHQLGDNTAFEVVAYYKDVTDLTQIFHQSAVPTAYDYYANTDYGTVKGFDFNLTMRRTRNVSLQMKYSLSYATGTGSYANTQFNIAWKNAQGAPKQTFPLDYDQRHSLIGIVDVRTGKGEGPKIGDYFPLENFGLNTVIQLASGLPYTPTKIYDGVSPNASVQQIPTGSINSANLPWTFVIDMKMERTFKVGNYNLVPYLWIKNLLDRDNVLGVYEGTGEANTSGYLETAEGQIRASDPVYTEFASRYDFAQQNPKNYGNPRMIMLGLRMSF